MGGCYNKLSNEDIKRLGGKRPYVCQFNKIHIHIGPVLQITKGAMFSTSSSYS